MSIHDLGHIWSYGGENIQVCHFCGAQRPAPVSEKEPPNPRLQATGSPVADVINSADGPAPEAWALGGIIRQKAITKK